MSKLDVLVTDGNYKHTYAIVKALNQMGLKIGVVSNKRMSISFLSRYVTKRFLVNSDVIKNPSPDVIFNYKNEIIEILKNNEIDVLMPVSNISFNCFSHYSNDFLNFTRLVVPPFDSMRVAQNKSRTFKFAKDNNINIPITYFPQNEHDIRKLANSISYPCVLKKTNFSEGGVKYCHNYQQLIENFLVVSSNKQKGESLPIIQELIIGPGFGFYAIFNQGKCVSYFMHERVHEYPITGGASTLAKSVFDENLLKAGLQILELLNWHGVAMVEFKKDLKDGIFKLIEINPKFWGSLELSTKAGINFPYLMYQQSLGIEIQKSEYIKDYYFRWTLPNDFIWFFHANKKKREEYFQLMKDYKINHDLNLKDPLVFLYNIFFTLYKLFKDKKYPHGILDK
jgi:predicted ATP-grasp superfamily ATP-dependent carboligase